MDLFKGIYKKNKCVDCYHFFRDGRDFLNNLDTFSETITVQERAKIPEVVRVPPVLKYPERYICNEGMWDAFQYIKDKEGLTKLLVGNTHCILFEKLTPQLENAKPEAVKKILTIKGNQRKERREIFYNRITVLISIASLVVGFVFGYLAVLFEIIDT